MSDQPNLGAEIDAFLRQGAKDLYNAIVPAFPESARGVDEMGTPLSPTPQIVTEELKGYDAELDMAAARGQGMEQERGLER